MKITFDQGSNAAGQTIPSFQENLFNGNYADLNTSISALGGLSPETVVFWNSQILLGYANSPFWQFTVWVVDPGYQRSFTLRIVGATDPTPSSFSTDFPGAIQLSSANASFTQGSDLAILATSDNYDDFKLVMTALNPGGPIFYRMRQEQQSPALYAFSVVAFDQTIGLFIEVALRGSSDPTPSSFATDYPAAIRLNGPFGFGGI